jgi:hypothetical protein
MIATASSAITSMPAARRMASLPHPNECHGGGSRAAARCSIKLTCDSTCLGTGPTDRTALQNLRGLLCDRCSLR